MAFYSDIVTLCRGKRSTVVDVVLDVLHQLGVWVIRYYDAHSTEDGGYDTGEAGSGAEFED